MGLDIYLYRRNKKKKRVTIKEANKEIITLLEQSPIKELRKLKEYSQHIEKSFVECLKEAINDYVGVIHGGLNSEEVSHVKGLWSIICMFHDYNESGRNRVLKQDEVKEIYELIAKSLCDVERHFEDKGFKITESPMSVGSTNLLLERDNIITPVINRGSYKDESIGKIDHTLEFEANKVCYDRFYFYDTDPLDTNKTKKRYDAWIYERLINLYKDMKKIMDETDFSNQEIVMNANW